VTRWFLREDTIKAANAALVNFHHQLPISRVWGEGIASSSDGQRFGIQKSSLLASYYPGYFGYYELAGRCLFFANRGEFRSGDAEEIMNKASCLSLLSNAVLVWNTLRITEIVNQLRAAGHTIADQDLARVSPLMHTHVIPNGTYRFSDEEEPEHMYAAAS
jgi:TnpA family transposase